ncbi:MAG: hypothetical protein HY695_36075 [Deltaproteobacteria bacterium]|nr:hypothetical protein [Deltaproteobacteria bacterium]
MTLQRALNIIGGAVAIASIVGSAVAFLYGSWRDVETRRIEARKPFLDEQLKRYTEVTRIAATLATANRKSVEFSSAEHRFWSLYWAELALVESKKVEAAMVAMGRCLKGDCSYCKRRPDLEHCALGLAHACRESLSESWGVTDWRYE